MHFAAFWSDFWTVRWNYIQLSIRLYMKISQTILSRGIVSSGLDLPNGKFNHFVSINIVSLFAFISYRWICGTKFMYGQVTIFPGRKMEFIHNWGNHECNEKCHALTTYDYTTAARHLLHLDPCQRDKRQHTGYESKVVIRIGLKRYDCLPALPPNVPIPCS